MSARPEQRTMTGELELAAMRAILGDVRPRPKLPPNIRITTSSVRLEDGSVCWSAYAHDGTWLVAAAHNEPAELDAFDQVIAALRRLYYA